MTSSDNHNCSSTVEPLHKGDVRDTYVGLCLSISLIMYSLVLLLLVGQGFCLEMGFNISFLCARYFFPLLSSLI